MAPLGEVHRKKGESLESAVEEKEDIQIMCTDNKNGRKYDKGAYCPFCQRYVEKFPRHLRE